MLHEMNLVNTAFNKILSGKKTIELRLFDEKRQKISIGDNIRFHSTENKNIIVATVKALHIFKTFEELYKTLPLDKCGYEDTNTAKPDDMLEYYTAEQIEKYGVVGIELYPIYSIVDIKSDLKDEKVLDLLSYSVFNPTSEKLMKRAEQYIQNKYVHAIVFTRDEKYIGLCVFEIKEKVATILDIAVDTHERNKGTATALIDYIRYSFDTHEIVAETDDDAIGFYLKYGFVIAETTEKFDTKRYALTYKIEFSDNNVRYKLTDKTLLKNSYTENVVLLDWNKDIEKIKRFYSIGFGIDEIEKDSINDFESVGAVAYIKNNEIVSFADIMKIRQGELEIGAVASLPKERNKGYATEVVAFAANKIIEMGFIASLTTKEANKPMKAVAEKLGFISTDNVKRHYDTLIDQNNDPVHDPEPLKAYMDKWDGQVFVDKMQLDSEKSVLEIGVGTGRLAVKAASLCKEFYGIDISPKTIERAKENLAAYKNVNLICGDFLEYNFKETFDTVYSSLTFMHIEDKLKAICKVFDLLSDGGVFVLSIDKNQDKFIDIGTSRVKIFPDTPENIACCLNRAGFHLYEQFETEFAHIFVAKKWEDLHI